jgi:hypothetical protein
MPSMPSQEDGDAAETSQLNPEPQGETGVVTNMWKFSTKNSLI